MILQRSGPSSASILGPPEAGILHDDQGPEPKTSTLGAGHQEKSENLSEHVGNPCQCPMLR